jgi:3-deoxy-manno-octulosonate cytidylyltransferase (CMP-KDO synthetase)
MRILGVIPARFASSRFHAKPLVDIKGKSMIRRVYEQAQKSSLLTHVVVATDHEEIYAHVASFNGVVCMTNAMHKSGTDRCQEALSLQPDAYDYVINIQGDEPFIQPEQIDLLASVLKGSTRIATLAKALRKAEDLFNPNLVKVVFNANHEALYFSRSPIPHVRNAADDEWISSANFYKHIGMYAYRTDILREITAIPLSSLEKAESLEQLRWLENGYPIIVVETTTETMGIDTPDDLEKAIGLLGD